MGNRAVITLDNKTGLYLHWNGGMDSVAAFIKYCKLKEHREGEYGMARLTQVIANFFGGTTSIGVGALENLDCDNGDNGLYVVENWEIVERRFYGDYPEQDEYDLLEMLEDINERQPEDEQIEDVAAALEKLNSKEAN